MLKESNRKLITSIYRSSKFATKSSNNHKQLSAIEKQCATLDGIICDKPDQFNTPQDRVDKYAIQLLYDMEILFFPISI